MLVVLKAVAMVAWKVDKKVHLTAYSMVVLKVY